MDFRILGHLEVIDADAVLELGGTRQRALLARLAVAANRVVPVDVLLDDLWAGEPPPARPKDALQAQVSRARKALGDPDRLVARPPGYLLHLEPDELDAARFERLVARARAAAAAGDVCHAAATLEEADRLWRGPALAQFADYDFARTEAARLEELRVSATEERIEAELRLGRHAQVAGALEALVAAHPYRERLWGQWMLALYRSGRQTEALRTYALLRRRLADELGIEPAAELSRLEEAILLHSPELDWAGDGDGRAGDKLAVDADATAVGVDIPAEPLPCPYRGLQPFQEDDADYFFGRTGDVTVLTEKLALSRFLAVLGPSGSGKSSLLRAGLVPAVRRGAVQGGERWTIRVFTPGARPLTTLAALVTRLFPHQAVHDTLDRLAEDDRALDLAVSLGLAENAPDEKVFLVVDQLEEVFTLCPDETERRRFLGNLAHASSTVGGQVVVVVGLRADFYQRCAEYPELRARVADHQFLVGPLDADGLRQAVEEPARLGGLECEDGLVESILDDVRDRPGALPLLEHVLVELWNRRHGSKLTLAAYVASGGVGKALAQRANATYAGLTPARQDIARRILLRLVQPGDGAEDTRRRATIGELVTSPADEAEVEAVLETLAAHRLLTAGTDEALGERVVEITHEALIRGWPELRAWINEHRDTIRAQRRLTENVAEWDLGDRDSSLLYRGARLAVWTERSLSDLPEIERAFLEASRQAEHSERKAVVRRARMAVGGVVTAVSLVALVALVGLDRVANERDIARSRQLAAEAVVELPFDPLRSLALASRAVAVAETTEASDALRKVVNESPLRATIRHDGVLSTAFRRDGSRLVTAGEDGTVRVWNWAQGDEEAVLRGHRGRVNGAVFSPDGARLVSAGDDGTVRVWDAAGTSSAHVVLRGHRGPVNAGEFSRDGARVVSAGSDGTIRVWDAASGEEQAVLEAHSGAVNAVGFSPDGSRVVSGGGDGDVRAWDWAAGTLERALPMRGAESIVTAVAYSPDGRRIVTAGADVVRVWDLGGGGSTTLRGHKGDVNSAAFSPDGVRVVSASSDRTVRVWDWAAGGDATILPGHRGVVTGAVFSADGGRVASAGSDGTVRVWNWAGGDEQVVLRGHRGPVRAAAFSRDGTRVASAGTDGTVRVWEWAGTGGAVVLTGHGGVVTSVAFSPDGRHLASAGTDATVRVWDWAGGRQVAAVSDEDGRPRSATFTADGAAVVLVGSDNRIRMWTWAGDSPPRVVAVPERVTVVAAGGHGTPVVGADGDGQVLFWDTPDEEPSVLGARRRPGPVNSLAVSVDAAKVAVAGADGRTHVWDGADAVTVLRGHKGAVLHAAFSPDGSRVVTAGSDRTVRVWYWVDGGAPTVLRGHRSEVTSVAFSQDGTRVVSAGADGTVRVWPCEACRRIDEVRSLALARAAGSDGDGDGDGDGDRRTTG